MAIPTKILRWSKDGLARTTASARWSLISCADAFFAPLFHLPIKMASTTASPSSMATPPMRAPTDDGFLRLLLRLVRLRPADARHWASSAEPGADRQHQHRRRRHLILVRLIVGHATTSARARPTPACCCSAPSLRAALRRLEPVLRRIGAVRFVITQYHTSVMFARRSSHRQRAAAGWGNAGGGAAQARCLWRYGRAGRR